MSGTLSLRDEAELRAYFGRYRPGAPGDRSDFGAICARLASGAPGRTAERPTPGTPWTEIVECAGPHGAINFDGEEATVAYIDARWRFRRVSEAVSRLSTRDLEVLNVYYGSEPSEHPLGALAEVACLTETARVPHVGSTGERCDDLLRSSVPLAHSGARDFENPLSFRAPSPWYAACSRDGHASPRRGLVARRHPRGVWRFVEHRDRRRRLGRQQSSGVSEHDTGGGSIMFSRRTRVHVLAGPGVQRLLGLRRRLVATVVPRRRVRA
jgi:hypothetical protein